MAAKASFDISTGADLQEVDNAVNQARKEIQQRFDFRGVTATLEFDRAKAEVRLAAEDEFRMRALVDVLLAKLVKRGVPTKNLTVGPFEPAAGQSVRATISLTQGIAPEIARRIVKAIRDNPAFKKAQASIQGDEIRVTSPSRDELQSVITFLKSGEYGIELQFGNFRS